MFAAEPPQEPLPYGRWGDALGEQFAGAAEADIDLDSIAWFPDRTWNGRTYVPATAPAEGGEVFGYVSYTREHEGAQAADFGAAADFTEETAAQNPDWTLDLSDEEIGHWRGPEGRRGIVTLVWGVALVPKGCPHHRAGHTTDQCTLVPALPLCHRRLHRTTSRFGLYGARGAICRESL